MTWPWQVTSPSPAFVTSTVASHTEHWYRFPSRFAMPASALAGGHRLLTAHRLAVVGRLHHDDLGSALVAAKPRSHFCRRHGGQTTRVPEPDDFSDLTFEVDGAVAVITLCRPARRNAFTRAMGDSLGAAYRRCDEDDAIRAVVVTGAGDAFCAGADLSPAGETFAAPTTEPGAFTSSPVRPRAWEVRKPVLAAMNGHAIGIGMTLAMQCDLRIMATGAKYGFVHVRRGVIPDAHAHWTVPRAVGFAQALDLLLTGRHFTAEEAVAMGLATRAAAPGDVLTTALGLARELATNTAPLSVAITKRLLWASPPLTADDAERLETAMHHHVMGEADAREGVMAFLERRDPEWTLSPTEDWPDRW
jgi:enoyl-CoA hydratase/carnithine racemase